MKNTFRDRFSAVLVIASVVTMMAALSIAQSTETVLHTFTFGKDGGFPSRDLLSIPRGISMALLTSRAILTKGFAVAEFFN